MTNGEKFQQIFAVSQVDECDLNVYAWLPCHDAIEIPLEWWNTNYSEIPTGSTTKNDLGVDCIDRKATLDAIIKRLGIKNEAYLLEAERVIYQQILAMPSVTPQPRKGHWIVQPSNKEQGERDFIWWKCSECGQVIFSETEKDRKEFHAFCGRCGAKMESEE